MKLTIRLNVRQISRTETHQKPARYGSTHIDLPSHRFTHHFVETFDRTCYTIDRFQLFTYDPMYCDSGKCELQTFKMSIPRGVPEQKKIPTLAAATKPLANVTFSHSLNSGVGVHESRVARGVGACLCWAVFKAVSSPLSGAEKVKSVEKVRTHGNQTG